MATSKDDIKYGTAQARHSKDTTTREAYKAGTPLEGGKIADSEPVDLFSSARNIEKARAQGQGETGSAQPQMSRDDNEADQGDVENHPNTTSRRLPKKSVIPGP